MHSAFSRKSNDRSRCARAYTTRKNIYLASILRNAKALPTNVDLSQALAILSQKKVTIGFDGFIDIIAKAVDHTAGATSYIQSSIDLAGYITSKGTDSFSLDINTSQTKAGGNMPIMANALATMGAHVNCIGALGLPAIDPIFNSLHSNCELYSFANPGKSIALEFRSSKMILNLANGMRDISWENLNHHIGFPKLLHLYTDCHLIGMVNWSELDYATELWQRIFDEVVMKRDQRLPAVCFFDLADCSRRARHEVMKVLQLINQFTSTSRVILSLNLNEASHVYNLLQGDSSCDANHLCAAIHNQLNIFATVVHHATGATCMHQGQVYEAASDPVDNPVVLTGAGDHFNAGFCAGLLLDLPIAEWISLGDRCAAYYISHGNSASLDQLSRNDNWKN